MEKLAFQPISNKSVVDRIVDSITQAIVNGTLHPGDQIPTEMELAESMGISRNSVREAVKILEAMGVVDIRRAEGTFVSQGFQSRMLDPVVYGLILENGPASEVIELRRIFEAGIMQLAVEKATREDVLALEQALRRIEAEALKPVVDIERLHEADLEFHKAIERAAHNTLATKVGDIISRLSNPTRRRTVTELLDKGQMDKFAELHRQLFDVISRRDLESMRPAIEDHYQYWKAQFPPELGA